MKKINIIFLFLFAFAISDIFAVECRINTTLLYDYNDQWHNIPEGRPPFLPVVKSVVKKQYFDVHVFLWKFKTADNKADCTYKIKIIKPDGKIYYSSKELVAYKGKFAGTSVLKTPGKLQICFEAKDPLGKYQIETVVYDKIAKTQASAKCLIELKAMPEKYAHLKIGFDKKNKPELATNYYRNPQPEKLIPFFLGLCQLQEDLVKAQKYDKKKRHACNLMMAFCYYTFKNNKYLIPSLIRAVEPYGIFYKRNLVFLLHNLNMLDEKLYKELGDQAQKFAAKLKQASNPFEFGKVRYSEQEDILWAQFFATGKYLPIKKLAEVMTQLSSNMSIKRYKSLKTKTVKDKKQLYEWIIALAARWSLQSNAIQHNLVFYYCETLYMRDIKNRFLKACLDGILQQAEKIRFSRTVQEKLKEEEKEEKKK